MFVWILVKLIRVAFERSIATPTKKLGDWSVMVHYRALILLAIILSKRVSESSFQECGTDHLLSSRCLIWDWYFSIHGKGESISKPPQCIMNSDDKSQDNQSDKHNEPAAEGETTSKYFSASENEQESGSLIESDKINSDSGNQVPMDIDTTEEEGSCAEGPVPVTEEEKEEDKSTTTSTYAVENHSEGVCNLAAFPPVTDFNKEKEEGNGERESSENTVPYSLEEGEAEEPKEGEENCAGESHDTEEDSSLRPNIEYSKGDFESASDNTDEDMGNKGNKAACGKKELSDDSGDEGEPRKEKPQQKKEKKQTTLPESWRKKDKGKKRGGGDYDDGAPPQRYSLRKRFSDRDTETYRRGYPGKEDDPRLNKNLQFYKNEIQSDPDGDFIDEIHKKWWGRYDILERHHGYIQWLFPIREDGMNWQAQALQKHEAEAIVADKEAHKRVLKSYEMMLDFYGMKFKDAEKTGALKRTENYEDRFDNLNWSAHNYLRITRILKCLGEMNYEHLKKGFIQFMLKEALDTGELKRTLTSCRDYWIGTIKDDNDREELHRYIEHHTKGR